MSQIKKLLEKFKRRPTPTDLLFSEADRLLRAYGFAQRQPSGGGSHYIYTHPELKEYAFTIANHGGKIKKGYARNTVKAIEKVRELFEEGGLK